MKQNKSYLKDSKITKQNLILRANENVIINMDIRKIYQPRTTKKTFENIEDLALTIKYNGLINPLLLLKLMIDI
jgi:hypothetical protein